MNKCKDCDYWERKKGDTYGACVIHSLEPPWGSDTELDADGIYHYSVEDDRDKLRTGPEFGCIHWRGLPEKCCARCMHWIGPGVFGTGKCRKFTKLVHHPSGHTETLCGTTNGFMCCKEFEPKEQK